MKNNFIAVYPDSCEICSYVIKYLISCSGRLASFRESGGASGSRAHPTFSACPAGQDGFAYTCGILSPPLKAAQKDYGILSGIPLGRNE